jgi:hypothetical protein
MTIDLNQLHISRPEKIRWRFANVTEESTILSAIKSKNLRKFLAGAEEALAKNAIRYEYKQLTKDEFLAWLPFYQAKMEELEYDVIASEEWYLKKMEQGLTVEGMFFYDLGHTLIGSGIFTRKETEKGTFAFKATERIDLSSKPNSSLGAVIDFFFIREMVRKDVAIISGGVSRNAFGVINSLGYLDYKLRFGYEPSFAESVEVLTEVPSNSDGIVLFYGLSNEKMALYALRPKGITATFEQARFSTPELPFIELEY